MVLPFTAKAKFRKIFHFVPGPRHGAQVVIEEARVRAVLQDLKVRLRECEVDIRGLSVKYAAPDAQVSPGEMENDQKRLVMLGAQRERLEARQKRAVAAAKKCGFSFLEIYDSYPSETNQAEYQPLI